MGKIVISTNMSLDGVVQDPDGQEGSRLGGWFGRVGGADLEPWGKVMLDEALGTDALLMGRRTDEWFGTRWSAAARRVGRPVEQPAEVRGVLHPRAAPLDQRHGPAG